MTTYTYTIVEEVGDSRPREWRNLYPAGLTAGQAANALQRLRNSSPSARFARDDESGLLLTSRDLLDMLGRDGAL